MRFLFGWFDDNTMTNSSSPEVFGPAINRFTDVMAHSDRFAFKGVTRLAREAGVSPSSVSRLINGRMNPSFLMVSRLTGALERTLGFRIDPRDLVAENGQFLCRHVCDLMACPGCLPDIAWDEFGSLKPTYADVDPGKWVTSRHPKGLTQEKGES